MCGIVGYIGTEDKAAEVLFAGLARLEYRGYDSAGVACVDGERIRVEREVGKLVNLTSKIANTPIVSNAGIGHTRWATHGKPCVANAHPHLDCSGKIAVVHNGIIENHATLREDLINEGHTFLSETDTEVIAHLLEKHLQQPRYKGNLLGALARTILDLDGAYAIAAMHIDYPDMIVAGRKDSPLIIGKGVGENIIASDIPAVLEYTRDVVILHDQEIAKVTKDGIQVFDLALHPLEPEMIKVEWDLAAAEKGGFDWFMLKEIHEQPRAIRETLRGRMVNHKIQLSELAMSDSEIAAVKRVIVVACGTSYHVGMVAKTLIEAWARVPVEVQTAAEFRYCDPIINKDTLVIAISQSGETADTLAGVREARELGARVFAVTNVVGSRITRESDGVIYTVAGPEISVASTKAFTAQIAAVYIVALKLAYCRKKITTKDVTAVYEELMMLPEMIESILEHSDYIKKIAEKYASASSALYLGRGIGVPVAMEGALKLKEISYIHAEAYPAGEMKHGPIALVTEALPVIGVATNSSTYSKTMSNVEEVRSRGAKVILVATEGNRFIEKYADDVMYVPETTELLSAITATIPLQLFSYYLADSLGRDIDQPRNLAKSVTVE